MTHCVQPEVMRVLERQEKGAGGEIVVCARVVGLFEDGDTNVIETTAGAFRASNAINCAGLYSDRVTALGGQKPEVKVVPFRGEYFELKPGVQHLCRNLIYPVPDTSFPFLGVHFTRLINGGVECGPNAVLAFAREGYSKTKVNLYDLAEALGYVFAPPGWSPDGSTLTSDQRQKEDKRLQRLVDDPDALASKQKSQKEDEARTRKMVGAMPDADRDWHSTP